MSARAEPVVEGEAPVPSAGVWRFTPAPRPNAGPAEYKSPCGRPRAATASTVDVLAGARCTGEECIGLARALVASAPLIAAPPPFPARPLISTSAYPSSPGIDCEERRPIAVTPPPDFCRAARDNLQNYPLITSRRRLQERNCSM